MTTSVTFEVSTIADAVRRAARVAPGKAGVAFDKAAGIFFEINPGGEAKCIMRATNLDAFHTEILGVVSAEGDPARWRLPSQLTNNVIGSLPPKSGAHIKFIQDGSKIKFQSGKMRGQMNLIDDESYPDWDMFDGSNLTMVNALGGRISMVEWAADTGAAPPLCGVYLDGQYATATDRYKLARVPCKVDLPGPVLVPAGILGNILKAMGDTGVGMAGTKLLLAPDDFTQIATVTYDATFPPVGSLFDYKYEGKVEVSKADFLEKLNRACQYSGADRNPVIRTFWGKGGIAVMMENAEIGLIGDVVEVPGQLDHARIEIMFTPKNIIDALNHAPEAKVTLHYDIAETDPRISRHIKVEGGAGYECIVMKRQSATPTV